MITLLHNWSGELGVDQLNLWANAYGLEHPVIDDRDFHVSDALWPGDSGRPNAVLLGSGARIVSFSPTEDLIIEELQ